MKLTDLFDEIKQSIMDYEELSGKQVEIDIYDQDGVFTWDGQGFQQVPDGVNCTDECVGCNCG